MRACLSLPYLKNNTSKFRLIFCARYMWLAVTRSSFNGNAIRYELPLLWMTSCFHQWVRIKDAAYVSTSSRVGGIGGEVCRLRLHLVRYATLLPVSPRLHWKKNNKFISFDAMNDGQRNWTVFVYGLPLQVLQIASSGSIDETAVLYSWRKTSLSCGWLREPALGPDKHASTRELMTVGGR